MYDAHTAGHDKPHRRLNAPSPPRGGTTAQTERLCLQFITLYSLGVQPTVFPEHPAQVMRILKPHFIGYLTHGLARAGKATRL